MKSHRATISGENWSVHHAWSWFRSCWLRGPWTMVHQAARVWLQLVSLRCFWTCWHVTCSLFLATCMSGPALPSIPCRRQRPSRSGRKSRKSFERGAVHGLKTVGDLHKVRVFLISASSFFGSSWWHFFSFWVWDWRILEVQCLTLTSRVQLCRALIAFARSGFAGAFDSDPHRV